MFKQAHFDAIICEGITQKGKSFVGARNVELRMTDSNLNKLWLKAKKRASQRSLFSSNKLQPQNRTI